MFLSGLLGLSEGSLYLLVCFEALTFVLCSCFFSLSELTDCKTDRDPFGPPGRPLGDPTGAQIQRFNPQVLHGKSKLFPVGLIFLVCRGCNSGCSRFYSYIYLFPRGCPPSADSVTPASANTLKTTLLRAWRRSTYESSSRGSMDLAVRLLLGYAPLGRKSYQSRNFEALFVEYQTWHQSWRAVSVTF